MVVKFRKSALCVLAAFLCSCSAEAESDNELFELESCEFRGVSPPGLDEPLKCDHYITDIELSGRIDLEFLYSDGWRLIQVQPSHEGQVWWVYLERRVSSEWLLHPADFYQDSLAKNRNGIETILKRIR